LKKAGSKEGKVAVLEVTQHSIVREHILQEENTFYRKGTHSKEGKVAVLAVTRHPVKKKRYLAAEERL